MPPAEAFLSHASANREAADEIAELLRKHGVPTFYAPTEILGAQQWQNEIIGALDRCDWFLVLLSPQSVESMWVRRETAYALAERRYEDKIVPLMLQDCDLGGLAWLKLFQTIDFRANIRTGCRDLLKIWGIGLKSS